LRGVVSRMAYRLAKCLRACAVGTLSMSEVLILYLVGRPVLYRSVVGYELAALSQGGELHGPTVRFVYEISLCLMFLVTSGMWAPRFLCIIRGAS
jgi:hypothetical protein